METVLRWEDKSARMAVMYSKHMLYIDSCGGIGLLIEYERLILRFCASNFNTFVHPFKPGCI